MPKIIQWAEEQWHLCLSAPNLIFQLLQHFLRWTIVVCWWMVLTLFVSLCSLPSYPGFQIWRGGWEDCYNRESSLLIWLSYMHCKHWNDRDISCCQFMCAAQIYIIMLLPWDFTEAYNIMPNFWSDDCTKEAPTFTFFDYFIDNENSIIHYPLHRIFFSLLCIT